MFFFNYAIGWLLTYKYQPEFIWNNNVARVFVQYNICIGVDSFPARPIASIIFILAMIVLGWSCWFMLVRLRFEDCGGKWLRGVRYFSINVGMLGCSIFGLTYAVPPDDKMMTVIHVGGFVLGLFGYALIKLAGALEFQAQYPDPESEWPELEKQSWAVRHMPHKIRLLLRAKKIGTTCLHADPAQYYYWTRLFAFGFLTGCGLYLGFSLIWMTTHGGLEVVALIDSTHIPAIVTGGSSITPEEIKPGWAGWFLVLFALVDPVIAIFFMKGSVAYANQTGFVANGLVVSVQQLTAMTEEGRSSA